MSLMVVGGLESGGGLITVADESMSGHPCVITSLIPAPTPPEGDKVEKDDYKYKDTHTDKDTCVITSWRHIGSRKSTHSVFSYKSSKLFCFTSSSTPCTGQLVAHWAQF